MLIHRLSAGFEKCKAISQKGFDKFKVFFIDGETKSELENEPKSEFIGKQKSKFNNKNAKNTSNKIPIINAKFLCIVLLNAIIYAIVRTNGEFESFALYFFRNFTWNFAVFFVLFFLCSLLGRVFFKIALNVVFWANLIVVCVNLFLLINFHAALDPVALQIFLATNTREASEFIAMYANTKTILALAVLAFLTLWAYLSKFSLHFTKRLCVLVSCLCLAFSLPTALKSSLEHTFKKTQLLDTAHIFNKGYQEQLKFLQAYKELDEKIASMLTKKFADKRERERERETRI